MGAAKLLIEIESADPRAVHVGGVLAGGKISAIRIVHQELISASDIAERYSVSATTVRRRLAQHNQGTHGKFLYDPAIADAEFKNEPKKRGRPRAN